MEPADRATGSQSGQPLFEKHQESEMSKLKIGVIISSTRPTRFGEKPAQWILDKANERAEIDAEMLDLRDFDLPMFDEMASNLWMPSANPKAVAWQNKLAEFDGFIV